MDAALKLKPILIEFPPLILLGFGLLAIKYSGNKPGHDNWIDRRLQKMRWDEWLLTVIIAMGFVLFLMKMLIR